MQWKWLRSLSIKNKLIVMVFGITAASLLSFATVVIVREIQASREDLVNRMITTARLLGDYSIVDLTFRDQKASARTLQTLSVEPAILCARIYDSAGNIFSEYNREPSVAQPRPQIPSSASHVFEGKMLHVFQLITDSGGQSYGTIYMQVSTESLRKKCRDSVLAVLIALIVLLAAVVILSARLQRIISGPILSLAAATQKVSEGKSYAIRAEKSGEDELGLLSEGFNQMLATIESRNQERERVESALRESEARYRSLVESSPDGILVERKGGVVYSNPSALRMFGYESFSEMKDRRVFEFLGHDIVSAKDSGTPSPLEKKLVNRNGQELNVEISFIPTSYESEFAIQWLIRDITERKNLALATQRMERLAALGEFSATTAHEIRNALGSISLNFQYLSNHMKIPGELQKTFTHIEQGIQRIQTTIKGILAFTRPSLPVLRKVDIHKVIESSLRYMDDELKQSGITLLKEFQANQSVVRVDPNQMIQVFTNLFSNSVHSMEDGGQLRVRTANHEQWLEVVVHDSGKGIKEEHLTKIFDPFFTTRSSGTGLGLAVVSRILEQHKIQVRVESKPDCGTSFILRIRFVGSDIT